MHDARGGRGQKCCVNIDLAQSHGCTTSLPTLIRLIIMLFSNMKHGIQAWSPTCVEQSERAYLHNDNVVLAVEGIRPAIDGWMCSRVLHDHALAQVVYGVGLHMHACARQDSPHHLLSFAVRDTVYLTNTLCMVGFHKDCIITTCSSHKHVPHATMF